MADAELKLYYFNGKGRAEVARLILAAAGEEFEDIRFSFEKWPEYKPLAPFGQAPFLKIDDKAFGQSMAINSFLAREFGFHGETNLEALKIDQIAHLVEDFFKVCVDVLHLEDEEKIQKGKEKTRKEVGPKLLSQLEKLLEENNTGHFVGDPLTLADIVVFDVLTGLLETYIDFNDSYPLLHKFVETIKAHSKIGPYLVSRPVTPL